MTAPKPKRKSSSSRPPTSASKSTTTSPNLSAAAPLGPDPAAHPANSTDADHKLALQLQAQSKPPPRSRSAKPASASASTSASATKPVSSGSAQASTSAAHAGAGGGRDRKGQGKGKEGEKKSPPPVLEGSRKTSRSAASAARQKTAVAMGGGQVEEEDEGAGEGEDDDEDEEEDSGITRCVCGKETEDLASGLMIECDTCKAWQHGPCVGLFAEKDCPDTYYCELCRPDLHDPQGLLVRPKPARKAPAHGRSPSVNQHPAPSQPSPHPPQPKQESLSTSTSSSRAKPRTSVDTPAAHPNTHPHPHPPADAPHDDTKPALDHSQKKRSTMNSRDAAYDDAIALSILEAGSAAARDRLQRAQSGEGEEGGEGEGGEGKRKASEEAEGREDGVGEGGPAGKKRRLSGGADRAELMEVDGQEGGERAISPELGNPSAAANGGSPPNGGKAKHPNQYTYRPKPAPGAAPAKPPRSPTKKGPAPPSTAAAGPAVSVTTDLGLPPLPSLPTPVPSSRNGAPARARGDGGASAARDLENGGWGVPEHLKHLRHLLPSPTPGFLDVPCAAPDASEPDAGSPPLDASPATKKEPCTRVRFPGKRMTLPEMRKRAKNVLDYMGRIQVELSDREKRVEQMARAGRARRERVREGDEPVAEDAEAAERLLLGAANTKAESLRMMDGLTKEILQFQQKYFGSLE